MATHLLSKDIWLNIRKSAHLKSLFLYYAHEKNLVKIIFCIVGHKLNEYSFCDLFTECDSRIKTIIFVLSKTTEWMDYAYSIPNVNT